MITLQVNHNTQDNTFKEIFELEYSCNRNYDFLLHTKTMGEFFVYMSVDNMGDFTAYVQIVNSEAVSKQFTYTLDTIETPIESYTGPVRFSSVLCLPIFSKSFL